MYAGGDVADAEDYDILAVAAFPLAVDKHVDEALFHADQTCLHLYAMVLYPHHLESCC